MVNNDNSYFQRRAEIEFEMAQRATAPQAARAHYDLAQAYRARLASGSSTGSVEST